MNYGLVEIGNIATKASTDAIRKLKSILDQHRIYHIVDGELFFHPQAKTPRSEAKHRDQVRKVDTTKHCSREYRNKHVDRSTCKKLIVPSLYELDYISLIYLDSEEAEFLATMVYEGD